METYCDHCDELIKDKTKAVHIKVNEQEYPGACYQSFDYYYHKKCAEKANMPQSTPIREINPNY